MDTDLKEDQIEGKKATKKKGTVAVPKKGRKKTEEVNEDKYEWWNESREEDDTIKWKTLEHNGVIFAPPYTPHGVKMMYDGKPVDLTPQQEEVATFFAAILETVHAKNAIFQTNFFRDFLGVLNADTKKKNISLKSLPSVILDPFMNGQCKRRKRKKR